jgi:hypothetical protein
VKTYEPTPRLHELLTAAAELELSEADARELGALLRNDSAARELYADYISVHALLSWRHGSVPPLEMPLAEEAATTLSPSLPTRRVILWATAASLLITVGIAAFYYSQQSAPPASVPANSIAIVVEQQRTKFDDGQSLATDEWLEAGRHRMSEGTARIALTSGVNLALEGPTDFELTSPERLHLSRGRVRAYVPVAARGFTITTSRGVQIVDLGTDFGVAVDEEQNVDVHVYSGSVMINGKTTLAAGQSQRIARDGAVSPGSLGEIEKIPELHMP